MIYKLLIYRFDYTKSIADPSIFNQPSSCGTDIKRSAEEASDVQETMKKVNRLIAGYQKQ